MSAIRIAIGRNTASELVELLRRWAVFAELISSAIREGKARPVKGRTRAEAELGMVQLANLAVECNDAADAIEQNNTVSNVEILFVVKP